MQLRRWRGAGLSAYQLERLEKHGIKSSERLWEQFAQPGGVDQIAKAAGIDASALVATMGRLAAHECRYAHQRVFRGHLFDAVIIAAFLAIVVLGLSDSGALDDHLPRLAPKQTLVAVRTIAAGEAISPDNTVRGRSRYARFCYGELPREPLVASTMIQVGRPICENIVRSLAPAAASPARK